jgi:hypothetical protein
VLRTPAPLNGALGSWSEGMRSRIAVFFAVTTLLAGVPIRSIKLPKSATADQCVEAESVNALPAAEMLVRGALANVSMGNLSKTEESQDLYNLGRIKRRLSKFLGSRATSTSVS